MVENKSGIQVMVPGKGDGCSVRHISQTKEDRADQIKSFREQKNEQQQIKEERFSQIKKRRRNSGRSGNGINITVDTDRK